MMYWEDIGIDKNYLCETAKKLEFGQPVFGCFSPEQ